MQIIKGKRKGGKTTEFIKMSAASGSYIVCLHQIEADRVFRQAIDAGYDIPKPITISDFLSHRYISKGIKGFLIDNVEALLSKLTNVSIEAISIDEENLKNLPDENSKVDFLAARHAWVEKGALIFKEYNEHPPSFMFKDECCECGLGGFLVGFDLTHYRTGPENKWHLLPEHLQKEN